MTLNSTSYKYFLWSLKLGAILNIYFLLQTFETKISSVDPFLLIPAQILRKKYCITRYNFFLNIFD